MQNTEDNVTYMSRFSVQYKSAPSAQQTLIYKNVRLCVITARLLRVEYSRGGSFLDEATQSVITRDLGEVQYKAEKKGNVVTVITKKNYF